jgi:hypothetical protein
MPRISIVLPVRDAEPWLGDCLESLRAQTEQGFELLAVDDGSRDRSRTMLDAFARGDSRVRVLETTDGSRGLVAALNLGLAEASAPYLARMDADDRMHPDRLRLQANALDEDDALFGVSCRARPFPADAVTDGMRTYVEWQNDLQSPEEIASERFVESPVLHPSVMLRTALVREALGGWREHGRAEDWDFFLRAFEAGLRIGRVPDILLDWRQHPLQLTRRDARYSADALLDLRAEFLARHLAPIAASGRTLWVLGAGPVGKDLVKALSRHGVVADGIVDVDARKIGGIVRGEGNRWRVIAHTALLAMTPRPFAVSAVSGRPARGRVRAELARFGWVEGDDFVVAA